MALHTARLSDLLAGDTRPARPAAFGRRGERSTADLATDVARLAAAVAARGRGRWLLHTEDAYAACVALFALAHAGCVAVLAPNRQPETLRRLAAGATGALLDPAMGDPPRTLPCLDPLAHRAEGAARLGALDRDCTVAELHTSGTTGAGAAVPKALRHLEDEVRVLEQRFGSELPRGARVFATVSHQHIYGLLFRILWPLAAGRAFHADALLHPQEIVPRMAEAGDCALVSSPAHLRRLAASGRLRELRGACFAVFSSGGPLDPETAAAVRDALGTAPHEILGSTETGGVAVRQRGSDRGEAWQPLPGVEVAREPALGRLVVTSAFASCGDETPGGRRRFTMGDRIELREDGTFLLSGRIDRTVKIGEKRLSLPEMERELEADPLVSEAALLVLPRAGEERVHAVVTPTAAGREHLREGGRRALAAQLADRLAASWDRVLLPRAWRFVDELPRDAQGKLPAEALAALFQEGGLDPELEEEIEISLGRELRRRLRVPEDLACLEGHFEGNPVVPGVVQIGWALDAAARILGAPPLVRGFEGLRFPAVLRPGDALEVAVAVSEDGRAVRFALAGRDGDARVFASGRCLLAAPAEAPA
jgi:acyl-coenzyme A synthetase/AMP-(fatty) acid ligase/3-hydroxymyristoyl/3-hydroxydecanoyl-(acyl carrier protein) dehydratase